MTLQMKMDKLEAITQKLEKGELELEEALALFEEGMALEKACEAELETIEKRVDVLLEDGTIKPFEEETGK